MTDAAPPQAPSLQPLALLDARDIEGVLTDLDDTLSTDGRLGAETYLAIERLHRAGVRVVPVTGRPAGWCDHFVRMWPVDAVIGETGAFYMLREGGAVRTVHMLDEAALADARARRDAIAEQVLREVPEAALAGDQSYRLVDLAIDINEAVGPLAPAQVARIVEIMRSHGMQAQPSAVHVNGWFGDFDKGRTAQRLLADRFGAADDAARARWVCIGDAPNDAPLFAAFRHSVGVANLRRHADRMPVLPAFITRAESGAGFVELADHILSARTGNGVAGR